MELVGWTDGRLVWCPNCFQPEEEDAEIRALMEGDDIPFSMAFQCEECGNVIVEQPVIELFNGRRKAVISPLAGGRFSLWVGYQGQGEDIPALWFKGGRTCGQEYANSINARRAAERFLNAGK